jgi:hypothetical protein
VGAVIDQPGDAKTKIAQLTKALESAIQVDCDIMIKNGSPPLDTNVTIGVGLFWFEGKTAMVEIVFVDGHLGHKIQYRVEPVQIIELRPNHLMALSHQEALRAPNPPSTSEIMFTPDKALDWFLNTQSQMTPKLVQPPFTMFRLTPSGGAWIENGDICRDDSHL